MLSTKEAKRHTPPWLKGAKAPVYLIRAGSVIDRAMVEAELAGEHQAGRVFAFELLQAFQAGLTALLPDAADRDELIDLASAEASGQKLAPAEAKLLEAAREELAKHWPDYRSLRARMARRNEVAPIIALRRFLIGMENVDVPFERGPDGLVTLETIGRIDPLEMLNAGNEAFGLLYPSELEGNSQPLSQSGESPAPLNTDGTSKADGKSGGDGGKKTRVSRSRRKSGVSSISG